jgi:lambda family phage portal protein
MSRLESLIGWASPDWAAKRARARTMGALFRAQYDMAKRRRADDGWLTPSTSSNAEVAPALVLSRDRARDLVRNNPYAARIVDVWVAHLIGDGITASWVRADGTIDEERQAAWNVFVDSGESDADGQLDFYGQQQLAARTMVESGEVLNRKRIRRPSDGLTVPLQFQLLEPDHLDHTKNEQLNNGGAIILGVQFTPLGRREGYWIYRNHPGDNTWASQRTSTFVSADQIDHLYRKRRPGQVRGVTWLAPVGNMLKDTGDLDDAVIMKAKIESCVVGVIESADETDGPNVGEKETGTNGDGDPYELQTMEPGSWQRLRPGEKATFSQPSASGGYEAYKRQFEQNIAVGAGITYDQLTGDLSRANFASLRAGKIEFRRDLSQIQWQIIIPMLCEPAAAAFDAMGIAAGKWRADGSKAIWMPPRNEPIDPKKDTEAEASDMDNLLEPWSDTVRKRGHDPRALAARLRADQELFAEFGISRVTKSAAPAPFDPNQEADDAQTQ